MEIKLFRKKFSQLKSVEKNQKGFMRPNFQQISVTFYAENCVQISVRIFVQFWLSLDAHKFSKALTDCVQNTTNFSKGFWQILTSVRCLHRHTYLPTPNTYLHTDTYLHTRAYTHTYLHMNILKIFTKTFLYTHTSFNTYTHLHTQTHTSSFTKDLHRILTSFTCPHRLTCSYLH